MIALGPAAAHAEPIAGPRDPQRAHEVKPGDTLTALAKKYGLTVAAIVKANRLPGPDTLLRVGQRLAIPSPRPSVARRGSVPQPRLAARPPAAARPPPPARRAPRGPPPPAA